ncbi:MAG: lipase family protein [Deltaproteobacteria bacterium]|nr:lipase family protein [Deltaproteobacteria bacterium]
MDIRPYDTSLNPVNAYCMAKLSALVYIGEGGEKGKKPDSRAILEQLQNEDGGFQKIHPYDNKSSQAMLVEHDQFLCMAFRGTDEIRDWFDNLDIQKREELFGVFHEGFWEATQDIWPQINRDYQHICKRDRSQKNVQRPLFLTGHSLGGAMATIAAARMVYEDLPFTSVYTFGQPRAMDRETGRKFNIECKDRFHRFCNDKDVVTRIPARIGGFTHVGQVVYIDNDMILHPEIGRWQQFVNTVSGAVETFVEKGFESGVKGIAELIQDHDVKKYIQAVERWDLKNRSLGI